ncbi:MAG: phenylacetic acid degradation protein [Flavobacteriales bacterium]|nr:phenylacetic acid degradation protein [Flavobacteriales bacterium]
MATTFHKIKVKDIRRTTKDCSVVTFDIPAELQEEFKYNQGQHLTLKAIINGEDIRRSYSLCSSPLDDEWKVAVKKIEDGRFSSFVNDKLKVGDEMEVMAPMGRFFQEISNTRKDYVAFAAGSGITPMHSIIKTHLTKEPESTFKLFYVNRTIQSIILKEEVEALKNQFMGRFELYHFLTREERDADLFNGRLTEDKMRSIGELLVDYKAVDDFFICGPADMIFMIRDFLQGVGVDKEKIHFELFGTPEKQKQAKKTKKSSENNDDISDVSIINNGVKTSFKMAMDGDNILDAALANNADLPFACKGGVCCTCRAKLIEGEVEMEVNYALEPDEVENNYILTCQAIPKTDKILVDFDS